MGRTPTLARWILATTLLSLACQRQASRAPASASKCSGHALQWVRQLSSLGNVSINRIATTHDNGIIAIGEFGQTLRIAGGTLVPIEFSARGDSDAFVLKITADGTVAWQRRIGGLKSSVGLAGLALRADDSFIVGGQYTGAPLMDSKPGEPEFALPAAQSGGTGAQRRLMLVQYGSDGVPRRTHTSADVGKDREITSLALVDGDVVIYGVFSDQLQLGEAASAVKLESRGLTDAFLARLGENGEPRWATRIGGIGRDTAGPLVVTRDHSILVAGTFADDGEGQGATPGATFGDNSNVLIRAEGGRDAYLARFDSEGRLRFAHAIGGPSEELTEPDAVLSISPMKDQGALIVANASMPVKLGQGGHFLESTNFDYGSLLARFSADGTLRWTLPLGATSMSDMTAVPDGDIFVLGKVEQRIYYPASGARRRSLTSEGLDDVLVARHGPQGELRWLTRFGGEGSEFGSRITADATGGVTFAFAFKDEFVIDACPPVKLQSQDRYSVLIARIAPDATLSDAPRERVLARAEAQVAQLRTSAEGALRSKNTAQACEHYRAIVELKPKDPGSRLDHASCLGQLSQVDPARSENLRAIALASRATDVTREADEKTRRTAYLNLRALDTALDLPVEGCRALTTEPGCSQPLWACAKQVELGGSQGSVSRAAVRIGITEQIAKIDPDEEIDPVMPSLEHWGFVNSKTWPETHNWTNRAEFVDVLVSERSASAACEPSGPDCKTNDGIDCKIVSANACLGLVGVVCTDPDDSEVKVDEFYLLPRGGR